MVTHQREMYIFFCKAAETGKEIQIVFCDISNTFNTVWYSGLFFHLEKGGLPNCALAWIRDYPQDRYLRIVVNNKTF